MLKNWKTSVAGFVTGILSALATGLNAGAFEFNFKSIIAFIVPVILGLLMKDYDTTGTGTGASKEANVSNV